jgi:glycosyltransferase involved in cell wall biosynthesis
MAVLNRMNVAYPKPRRVGIISTMWGAPWGGSEELWARTAQRALETGAKVSICLPHRPHPNHEELRTLEKAGADVFCLADSRLYVQARHLSRVAGVLHCGLGRYLRDHLSPLPVFFSTQFDVLLLSEGGSIPPIELIEAIEHYHVPRPYLILSQANAGDLPETEHRRRTAAFYRNARFALFVSESNWRATERQLTERIVNARVVKNPVNLDCTDTVPWPQEKSISFASVARLNTFTKGQDILFEVLSDPRWRHRDWHLCLYGGGDHDLYLQELARFYGLRDRIKFRGQTKDIRKVWQKHHALVLPSRIEGTPLVMVEAMICGRPVIGTAVAGIPEWVKHGYSGFLADAPAVNCFAAALEAAWQQRANWQLMGSNARKDALRLYDPTPADTLISLLDEAACRRQASGASFVAALAE